MEGIESRPAHSEGLRKAFFVNDPAGPRLPARPPASSISLRPDQLSCFSGRARRYNHMLAAAAAPQSCIDAQLLNFGQGG